QQALAELAVRKDDLDLLTKSAEALVKIEPRLAVGYTLRAVAEIAHKDFAAAEKDLNTAISLAPNDPTPYTRMGSLRAIQKRFPEAEKFYEQALEKNPDFLEALRGLVAVDVVQK